MEDVHHFGVAVATHGQCRVVVLGRDQIGQLAGLGDAVHQRHLRDPVALDADQLRHALRRRRHHLFDGGVAEDRTHRPIEGAGCAATLHVPEDGHPGVLTELLLQHLADLVAGDRDVLRIVRTLGDDHDAVPSTGRPTGLEQLAEPFLPARVGWVLRDEDIVGPAGDGTHQGEIAAVPAHHLDDEAALMAGGRAGDGVDGLDDPVQRGIRTDRHVSADHVVVDRPDQAGDHQRRMPVGGRLVDRAGRPQLLDQRRPLLTQQVGTAQAAVTADHHQPVDALEQQVVHGLQPSRSVPEFQ